MKDCIKIYKVKSFAYTPLQDEQDLEYFKENGIVVTNNLQEADVLVSQNFKHLKRYFWRFLNRKRYLVWTLEPRFDTNFEKTKKTVLGQVECHFMNIYTEDVFTSGLAFHIRLIRGLLEPLPKDFNLTNRRVAALMSYYAGVDTPQLLRNGENIDLIKLRSKIALKGRMKNVLDIYGKGWPEGISKEDSRAGEWTGRKHEILNKYHFNLCFENTIAYNYITEKIWDSIRSYCLPIYYGKGTNIYSLFPKESFIDYSLFDRPEDLFHYIDHLSDDEFIKKMNKCISVYNSISQQDEFFMWEKRKQSLDKLIEKLKLITSNARK